MTSTQPTYFELHSEREPLYQLTINLAVRWRELVLVLVLVAVRWRELVLVLVLVAVRWRELVLVLVLVAVRRELVEVLVLVAVRWRELVLVLVLVAVRRELVEVLVAVRPLASVCLRRRAASPTAVSLQQALRMEAGLSVCWVLSGLPLAAAGPLVWAWLGLWMALQE